MIYQELLEQLTEHYADMAMNPSTVEHARWMVRKLRDDPSELFKDLPELIKQRIEEKNGKKEVQA